MAITTAAWAQAYYPGIKKWFDDSPTKFDKEFKDLFDMETSKRKYEEYRGKSNFGLGAVKPEGGSILYDNSQQGFLTRLTNQTVGLGFVISREAREDDLYGLLGKDQTEELRFSLETAKEVTGANVYNRAETSGYTGGDGVVLLSTAHPNVAGGTYSNRLTTAAALSEASLEQAGIDIMRLKNDRGLAIKIIPKCLIVPSNLAYEAERILKTADRVGTANNDTNALKSMGMFPDGIKVNHYLTDTNNWFIRTNVPGMVWQDRRPLEITVDDDHDTENAKFKGTYRAAAGWFNPRALFGSSPA